MDNLAKSSPKVALPSPPGNIVKLNVGGKLFVTSSQTLTSCGPNSFLARIVSGLLPSSQDESGAYFIDRDPTLFEKILNFLRTKRIRLGPNIDIDDMIDEVDFYGIQPLIDRLKLCRHMFRWPSCGNNSFQGLIHPPNLSEFPDEAKSGECQSKRVLIVSATDKWLLVGYRTGVSCYPTRQFSGEAWPSAATAAHSWHQSTAPHQPKFIAIKSLKQSSREERSEQLLVACVTVNSKLYIWQQSIESDPVGAAAAIAAPAPANLSCVGVFDLFPTVHALLFAGRRQLVALNHQGDFSVWHYSRDFQHQQVEPISSYDECGSMMFFGHKSGTIKYFNIETLPVRMEDHKIILTDLYHDNENDAITALNVRIASNSIVSDIAADNQFYFEIAYGTASGKVKLMTEHAETIGHGPQLLFSLAVHRAPVTKVLLTEQHLVSNCSHLNHVRSWHVSRFRGLLSRNPVPVPMSSFNMIHLEPRDEDEDEDLQGGTGGPGQYLSANKLGPYVLSDSQIWYLQKITPSATEMCVMSGLNGECVHRIWAVDESPITCFAVAEEWRRSSAPLQYIFTGHQNGTVQVWNVAALNPSQICNHHSSSAGANCLVGAQDLNSSTHVLERLREHSGSPVNNSAMFKSASPSNASLSLQYAPLSNKPSIDEVLKMLDDFDLSNTVSDP